MKKFYLARCPHCEFTLPFGDRDKRDEWASEHSQTKDPFDGSTHSPIQTWEETR